MGSIHESLPHALELSRRGYNAFALQYRTGGTQVACEDLAAAISFVFRNAEELGVSTANWRTSRAIRGRRPCEHPPIRPTGDDAVAFWERHLER